MKLRTFKIMELNLDGKKTIMKVYHDTLDFVDGYASFGHMINDHEVVCTVFDKNLNPQVPARVSSVDRLDTYTNVFKNGMALYPGDDKIYVIDLKNTEFDGLIPKNPVNVINAYLPLDTKRVIAVNEEFFLYDVSNNKRLSEEFSYIEKKGDKLIWYLVFGMLEQEQKYLYATGLMDRNGTLKNEVMIENIKAWYSDDELKDVEKIRSLSLQNYTELRNDNKWTHLQ